ncbi:PLP-dependent aminotransferase family protein [uncultured Cohaesibacter sp.]|uniref:MocR-like pyridoxine biosynthesis transcription factor PdxR n=1 Tax=uncultured Cohaesibacter sp. TaxID=1002546 RepID=UPI00293162D5|nr:PLP-dependent aminotransferase family protein [uncultured Cohaesibacter sp.]
MLASLIRLDREDESRLDRQLFLQLRQLIMDGRLSAGSRLPASRSLATDLGIGRNTVLFAYEQLVLEGYVETHGRRGTLVSGATRGFLGMAKNERGDAIHSNDVRLSSTASRMISVARRDLPVSMTFLPGMPDVSQFPHDVWGRLLRRASRQAFNHPEFSGYGYYSGLPALKKAILDHGSLTRGIVAEADQVMIFSSAQAALDLVARLLLDEGDAALHEQPGYSGMLAALKAVGARTLPINVDRDRPYEGLDHLLGGEHRPRLVYCTPSHQFPTGRLMSLQERLSLLAFSAKQGCFILEDDYDSEFHFTGSPISSLQGLDQGEQVIYMGTFSKSLMPSLHVAYLIVPRRLVEPVKRMVRNVGAVPSGVVQAALAHFIDEGHFRAYVAHMTKLYRERRDCLVHHLGEVCGQWIDPVVPDGGIQLSGLFKGDASLLDDGQVAALLGRRGIEVSALSSLYWADGKMERSGLLFGYAASDQEEIRAGVASLARLLSDIAP